jgi:hypothetical protein
MIHISASIYPLLKRKPPLKSSQNNLFIGGSNAVKTLHKPKQFCISSPLATHSEFQKLEYTNKIDINLILIYRIVKHGKHSFKHLGPMQPLVALVVTQTLQPLALFKFDATLTRKAGFPLANFLARRDLFPLSASLIASARRGKMDADKGKRSLRAKKFACGKPQ